MNELERRYTPNEVVLRASSDRSKIGGYASMFNVLSRNLGGFVEQVMPSAFTRSQMDGWPGVLARYNHNDDFLLGTSAARTLELTVDEIGLSYVIDPPQSRADILELVQRGDVQHSSFAFRAMPDGGDDWTTTDQGYPKRSLLNVQLVDVAPVNSPAYPDTTAALRSFSTKFGAPLDEVRSLSEADELRKFFVRTDNRGKPKPKPKQMLGAAAAVQLMMRKQDPYIND
jgi:HK97 family phage prohead protease